MREKVSLESAATYILEECRMVLPGVQALFGFQLIAVFTEGFGALTNVHQRLHLAALFLVAVAIALVMAPAALHRQAESREVTERFIRVASRLVLASMLPLALAICVEVYLVSVIILANAAVATGIAISLAVLFAWLWLALPRRHRL